MDLYFVSKIPMPGDIHEVHKLYCLYLPEIRERISLGYFIDLSEAIAEAETIYHLNADGCRYYCTDYHPPQESPIVFL